MDGISAVGWAKRMVLPVTPFCWTSGEPLPGRTYYYYYYNHYYYCYYYYY